MSDVEKILSERGDRYGSYFNKADFIQQVKDLMHDSEGWERLMPDQKESLEMIVHKISRILWGDPDYLDSWDDIVGYTQLVIKRLNGGAP